MTTREQASLQVSLSIDIRVAGVDDLPLLEWYGQYAHFRNLFMHTFRDQQEGIRLMLVADCNGFPIGTVFILFMDEDDPQRQAYFYSLRVMDMFQGQGIGTRLMHEAEARAMARGCTNFSISVAKTNDLALRLYKRLGYEIFTEDRGEWSYTDHLGKVRHVKEPCWLLQKSVALR